MTKLLSPYLLFTIYSLFSLEARCTLHFNQEDMEAIRHAFNNYAISVSPAEALKALKKPFSDNIILKKDMFGKTFLTDLYKVYYFDTPSMLENIGYQDQKGKKRELLKPEERENFRNFIFQEPNTFFGKMLLSRIKKYLATTTAPGNVNHQTDEDVNVQEKNSSILTKLNNLNEANSKDLAEAIFLDKIEELNKTANEADTLDSFKKAINLSDLSILSLLLNGPNAAYHIKYYLSQEEINNLEKQALKKLKYSYGLEIDEYIVDSVYGDFIENKIHTSSPAKLKGQVSLERLSKKEYDQPLYFRKTVLDELEKTRDHAQTVSFLLNLSNVHWVTLLVQRDGQVSVVDSFGPSSDNMVKKIVKALNTSFTEDEKRQALEFNFQPPLSELSKDKHGFTEFKVHSQSPAIGTGLQSSKYDKGRNNCGIHALVNAIAIARTGSIEGAEKLSKQIKENKIGCWDDIIQGTESSVEEGQLFNKLRAEMRDTIPAYKIFED